MQPHLWATKLTSDDSVAKEQLGIIRFEYDSAGNLAKTYRYVKNTSGVALANGNIAVWDLTADDAYSVTTTATADVTYPAGVAIGALTNAYFGWIQIGGKHSAVTMADAVAAGGAFGTGAAAGQGGATAVAGSVMGFAFDDIGAAGTGEVFLTGLI